MKEDKYIKYLKQYKDANGDINTIPRNSIVLFEGETLKIGEFIASIRKQHRLYLAASSKKGCQSPLAISRYQALDELDFVWEPRTVMQQQLQENDIMLNFITAYYDKHHTFQQLPDEVEIAGTIYNIKNFISHVRINHKYYEEGKAIHGCQSPTFLKRYAELDKRDFEWSPKKDAIQKDKFIMFLEEYYAKNQTLAGIPNKVSYAGERLNMSNFFSDRRKKRTRAMTDSSFQPSTLEKARWQVLDKLGYDWDYATKKANALLENDPYIRYLEWHYNNYGTINNITAKQEVEFEGQILKIGIFINDYRKKHYAYTSGKTNATSIKTPLALKRYRSLEKLGIDWHPSSTQFSVARHAKEHGLRPQTLRKYLAKFNGDIEKATRFCEAKRRHNPQVKQNKVAKQESLKTIMDEFEVDLSTLQSALNKQALRTTPAKKSGQKLTVDGKTPLREYCINNGLNYTVIQKAIKLKSEGLCDEDLQSLINRVITEYKKSGQNRPSTWIYSKYGHETLVRHLLLSMNLDPDAILRDMSKNCISLEEAISNDCFIRNTTPADGYLAPLYQDLINYYNKIDQSSDHNPETAQKALIEYFKWLVTDYHLTESEYNLLMQSLSHYVEASETYKLYNVAFEKDPEKKVTLIIKYNLSDEEIEKAFFLPLQFDNKVLIGRESIIYERRMQLKNLTQVWNNLTEAEKQQQVDIHNLTGEEIKYVTKTRHDIDNTKTKVKQLKKK